MLANSEFVALLKQANTDSSKMAEVIGVSEAQLRFVTNTASGMGLIKCGSVVIPVSYTHLDVYKRQAGEGIKAGCAYEVFRGKFSAWS